MIINKIDYNIFELILLRWRFNTGFMADDSLVLTKYAILILIIIFIIGIK